MTPVRSLLLLLTIALPAGFLCPTAAAASAEIIQWSGHQSAISTPATRTVRNVEAWNTVWKDIGRDPPRALDIAREMAVAIFLGERRTGGYSAEILRASVQQDRFVVEYREKAPPPGAMVTQALTSPWVVAILPCSDLQVVVRKIPPAISDK